jgi:hypothetical protein
MFPHTKTYDTASMDASEVVIRPSGDLSLIYRPGRNYMI